MNYGLQGGANPQTQALSPPPNPPALTNALDDIDNLLSSLSQESSRLSESINRMVGQEPECAKEPTQNQEDGSAMGRIGKAMTDLSIIIGQISHSNDRLSKLI